jgi:hypothetical protein
VRGRKACFGNAINRVKGEKELKMKKVLVMGCIFFLACAVSYSFAQMGGGMMDGQQGQMMEPGQSQQQKTQPETLGAKIFVDNCVSCHPDGGNIIIPNLPLKGSRVLANFKTFNAFIRNPKMPDGSRGAMPSFTISKISDRQARALYHFIASAESRGMRGGHGMGLGMMGGGYGMGPGMMGGGGYGMGPGMMGPGYYGYSPECQKFYDETAGLRKELHDKRFEYFEVLRNPKATGEAAAKLENEIRELQDKIYAEAPLGCRW